VASPASGERGQRSPCKAGPQSKKACAQTVEGRPQALRPCRQALESEAWPFLLCAQGRSAAFAKITALHPGGFALRMNHYSLRASPANPVARLFALRTKLPSSPRKLIRVDHKAFLLARRVQQHQRWPSQACAQGKLPCEPGSQAPVEQNQTNNQVVIPAFAGMTIHWGCGPGVAGHSR